MTVQKPRKGGEAARNGEKHRGIEMEAMTRLGVSKYSSVVVCAWCRKQVPTNGVQGDCTGGNSRPQGPQGACCRGEGVRGTADWGKGSVSLG